MKHDLIRLLLNRVSFSDIENACSLGLPVSDIFLHHRRILYAKLEAQANEVIEQQYSDFKEFVFSGLLRLSLDR